MILIPTILCGGAGSRLWPVSRELHPKPFIRLADKQTFLQKAFLRASKLQNVNEILTVTNKELLFKIKDDYSEVNATQIPTSYILEPFARNTAAAIAAAAFKVNKQHGEDAMLLILAADHLITDQAAFEEAVMTAMDLAQKNKLVTFGIQPSFPETGYGYIEVDGNVVLSFTEKPSPEKALTYVSSGRHFWNSGMFCFRAGTVLEQMDKHCPDILAATDTCFHKSESTEQNLASQVELEPGSFADIREDSIDYALMEKSSEIAVVPCNIGWSDIGSWKALSNLSESDDDGNSIVGEAFLHNVKNCYIQSHDRIIGCVGIENIAVIDTPDALLVADKSSSQDVKHIYSHLKIQDHEAHKLHRTVVRPWGTYTVLEEGKGFKIKRIVVKPGASLSLQMHHHRCEHWVVVSGTAKVTNGDNIILIQPNESTYIPAGNKHRLENTTQEPITIIEVQTGDYLGEDDIIRFDDVYGRVKDKDVVCE